MGACASWCGTRETSQHDDVPYVATLDGHATLRPADRRGEHSHSQGLLAALGGRFGGGGASANGSRHAMQQPLLAPDDDPSEPGSRAPLRSQSPSQLQYQSQPQPQPQAQTQTQRQSQIQAPEPAFEPPAPLLAHVVVTDAAGERLTFARRPSPRPEAASQTIAPAPAQVPAPAPAPAAAPTPAPPLGLPTALASSSVLSGGVIVLDTPPGLRLELHDSGGWARPLNLSTESLGASASSVQPLAPQPASANTGAGGLASSSDSVGHDSSSSSSWTGGVSAFSAANMAALSASKGLSASTSSLPSAESTKGRLGGAQLLRQSSGLLARELLARKGSGPVALGLPGQPAVVASRPLRDRSLSNALTRAPADLTRQLRTSHTKFPKFPSAKAQAPAVGPKKDPRSRVQQQLGSRAKSNSTSSLVAGSWLAAPDEEELVRCMAVALWLHLARAHASPPAQALLLDVFSDQRHAPLGPAAGSGAADTLPELDHVYRFVSTIVHAERLAPECCILALAYIERMIDSARVAFAPSTWRRMTLSALILASKVWEDQAVWNVDFINVFPHALTCHELNQLEKTTLNLLQYNASLPASMYARYYFALRDLSDLPDHAYPPPLDPAAAGALELRAASHARRPQRSQSADRLTSKPPLLVLS